MSLAKSSLHCYKIPLQLLRTKSFSQQPVSTIWRCFEFTLLKLTRVSPNFAIDFGPYRFRMRLQTTKTKFGSTGIFVLRRYYEPLLEFGYKLIPRGSSVIDGGANQGIYSCAFAAAAGSNGVVYAFEPQRYAIECIAENARLNDMANITVFEAALSDTRGEAFLNLDQGPVSGFISDVPEARTFSRVRTETIDGLLSEGRLRSVQLIKLDVEGSELRALRGARAMLTEKPIICIEANNKSEYETIADDLGRLGYQPYIFDSKGHMVRFKTFVPSPNVIFAI